MKLTIVAFVLSAALIQLYAAEEPLIPPALNALLRSVRPGMTIPEVEAVLAPAYPTAKGRHGDGSGQSGYIEYRLDERHSLSVLTTRRGEDYVVQDKLFFYLYDWRWKRRINVEIDEWDRPLEKDASGN